MGWDNISELRPVTDLLFMPQMVHERGKPQWNDADRGESKNSEYILC
jgi:hypothetical protein